MQTEMRTILVFEGILFIYNIKINVLLKKQGVFFENSNRNLALYGFMFKNIKMT